MIQVRESFMVLYFFILFHSGDAIMKSLQIRQITRNSLDSTQNGWNMMLVRNALLAIVVKTYFINIFCIWDSSGLTDICEWSDDER